MVDTTQLAAATALYLTAGNADWLSGKYASPFVGCIVTVD